MSTQRHFIQPGDEHITFELPVTLEEVKLLHGCVADRYEADEREGRVARPTQLLLGKLSGLIDYLQSENYPNP